MKKRVLVFIDQANRDGISQLLIVDYLRRKGVKVYVANQHTFAAMFERCRPHVTYVSWLVGGPIMDVVLRNRHRSRIALIDQEGGRMGEEPFRRHFKLLNNGIKEKAGRAASKIFVWGHAHARWLLDMGIGSRETISVVGSPRFDPYLVEESAAGPKYLGVTLRGDAITGVPIVRSAYRYAEFTGQHGIGIGYPIEAQYEDKMWHVIASTRHLFKTASAFSRRSAASIVFRPGPWEQASQYEFLRGAIPTASIVPHAPQHDYVRHAFALLEESSSMGLEGLLAGVPVVSVQALIPRLADHIAGTGGGLYATPYGRCYWQPRTVDEAVDLLVRAERGELAASPRPDELEQYLHDYHGWPRHRPSSFQIGDAILELLDMEGARGRTPAPRTLEDDTLSVPDFTAAAAATDGKVDDVAGAARTRGKERIFRMLPGSVALLAASCFVDDLVSSNRQVRIRYHYYPWVYPHHDRVRTLFEALWQRYACAGEPLPESVT